MENNLIQSKNNKVLIIIIVILLLLVFAAGILLYLSYNKINNSKNNNASEGNVTENNYVYSIEDLKLKADSTLALSKFILNGDNILLSDNNKDEVLVDYVQTITTFEPEEKNYSWNEMREFSQKLFDGGLSDDTLRQMNSEKFILTCRAGNYNAQTNQFDIFGSVCEDLETSPINVFENIEQDNNNYYLYSRLVIRNTSIDKEFKDDYNELCSDIACDNIVMRVNINDYDPDYSDYEGANFTELKAYLKDEVKDLSKFKEVKYTFAKKTGGIKTVELVK